MEKGCSHSDVPTRPNAIRYESSQNEKDDGDRSIPVQILSCSRQGSQLCSKGEDSASNNDSIVSLMSFPLTFNGGICSNSSVFKSFDLFMLTGLCS